MSNDAKPILTAYDSSILPGSALLIILFEFFERFAFYATLSLLVVYLTAHRDKFGFGWDRAQALDIVGIYSGLMYGLPSVGGWIADRWMGHRRAVVIGAALMVAGYLLLAMPPAVVAIQALGTDGFKEHFLMLPGPLGALHPPFNAGPKFSFAYNLISASFWIALLTIVMGNALVKATLVILLGSAFNQADSRRGTAYAYYYSAINIGGLVAGLIAGGIAATFGWHAAFLASAAAIFFGLMGFVLFRPPPSRTASVYADPITSKPIGHAVDKNTKTRLGILAIFAALLFVYSAGSAQIWGVMTLFLETGIDRKIGAFQIPTQWFSSISGAGVIISAPLIAKLWRVLALRGREPDMTAKYAITLGLGGSGLLLFALSAWLAANGLSRNWQLPAVGLLLQAFGEVVAWTSTYGIVFRLAPAGARGAVMGVFYALTLGLGHYAAGALGGFASSLGEVTYFFSLGLFSLLVGAAALLLRPLLTSQATRIGVTLT